MTFVDTSFVYAVMDADDEKHRTAKAAWESVLDSEEVLITTNYVLVEALALVQSRLGMTALRALCGDVLPVLDFHFVSPDEHQAALAALLLSSRQGPSFVDCTSFEAMRKLSMKRVFAFDRHFAQQGFAVLPNPQ